MSPLLEPDIAEAQRFLERLDQKADSFTFQTFDDDPKRRDGQLLRVLHGSLDANAAELARLNLAGAGIFVTVNQTDGKGRKAENIVRVRAVFVDLDGAPLEPVSNYRVPSSMVVETSEGRWHAYWPVDGMELDAFSGVQAKLIEKFNADASVKDLPRVMRLPGFYHCKKAPRMVRIDRVSDDPPYSASVFLPKKSEVAQLPATITPEVETGNEEAQRALETQSAIVAEATGGKRNNSLNKATYTLGGLVGSGLLTEEEVRERLLLAADECGLPRKEAGPTITSGLNKGIEAPWHPGMVLDPNAPMRIARKLVDARYTTDGGVRSIQRHREFFLTWNSACYEIRTKEDIKAATYKFTEPAKKIGAHGPVPFNPAKANVENIVDALTAVANLSDDTDAPSWINHEQGPPPNELMALKNGLLHLPTGTLHPSTPNFFNTAASDVAYDPSAPEPSEWLRFLASIFDDDTEACQAMQEFFGYCLTSDTSQQKILLVVGPPRSGKGTSARVLTELVGRKSMAGPTMDSLGKDFGLEHLIPRTVAIISDARIGQRTDKAAVTERLLSISGEDTISVNRKNSSFWVGKLQTRFIIMTNELPALTDSSGALANRFVIVMLNNSFLGKEDKGLFEKLKSEMPGILNWAIEGYQRLMERGHFIQPESSRDALEEMMHLASPVRAFINDCCDVGPTCSDDVDALFDAWKDWCDASGYNSGSKATFGKNLRTVHPGIKRKEGGVVAGARTFHYAGIMRKDAIITQAPSIPDEEIPF